MIDCEDLTPNSVGVRWVMLGSMGPFPRPVRNKARTAVVILDCKSSRMTANKRKSCPAARICQSEHFSVSRPEANLPKVTPTK